MNVGDTVRLISGGPVMTVDTVREDEWVICVWFLGDALQREGFWPRMITPARKHAGISSDAWVEK